ATKAEQPKIKITTKTDQPQLKIVAKTHQPEYFVNENKSVAYIIRNWLSKTEADQLLSVCQTLPTVQHDFRFYGRPLKQKRRNWLCGDGNVVSHKFGGVEMDVNPWIPDFKEVRDTL